MEECTKETKEWEEALQNVNNIVLEILSNNPELIGKLKIGIGDNGERIILNKEEVLDEYQSNVTRQ